MAKKEAMVDLKREPQEKDESESLGVPAGKEGPHYPYGTKLHLEHEDLEKLGMDTPRVGDKFHVHGHAHVTSVSEDEHQSDSGKKRKSRRVELHIRKMSVSPSPRIPKSGRAGGKYADAAMGAKDAMDAALATSDDE